MRAIGPLFLVGLLGCLSDPAEPGPPDTGTSRGDDGSEDTRTPPGPTPVRVVTWNVEGVGAAGSAEHEAVAEVLLRLNADIVMLNEIDASETGRVESLAARLGYDHVLVPSSNPFGDLRNGVISRLPFSDARVWTSRDLSGDAQANDLTRSPVSVTVEVAGRTLSVVGQHWKSGFDDIDELRRAVDGIRTAQAAERVDADFVLVVGDMNHEVDESEVPSTFTSVPSGAPSDFWLGADLYARLQQGGIGADPFVPLAELGLTPLAFTQADGRTDTRDASGRRIDWIHGNDAVAATLVGGVVYDARDDDRVSLSLAGNPPARESTALASDHFPVLVEFAPNAD